MNEHWKSTTIEAIAEVVTKGTTPTSVGFKFTESGINFVKVETITPSGQFLPSKFGHIDEDCHQSLKRSQLASGDILFSIAGALGRTAQVTPEILPANTNQALAIIRLKQSPDVMPEFILRALSSGLMIEQIEKQRGGVAQQNLSLAQVKNFQIPLPPLSEQKRIVSIVDEAFEAIDIAIDNTKQNLTNARELFDSIISTVIFGGSLKDDWHSKTVADVILAKKGSMRTGPFGSQLLHGEFVDEGIAVLGIDNAVKNKFQWDRRRFITPKKYLQLSRYKVNPGDVLITIMGTFGRCAIVPDDIPIAINTKHFCCITLDNQKCLPGFLHAYFLYHPIAQQFLLKRAKGSIMAGLNMEIIKELPLQLPSIPTQQRIIEEVRYLSHETQRLKTTYQQKLIALNELKQSILHKAFTGELTADRADLKTNIEQEAIAV